MGWSAKIAVSCAAYTAADAALPECLPYHVVGDGFIGAEAEFALDLRLPPLQGSPLGLQLLDAGDQLSPVDGVLLVKAQVLALADVVLVQGLLHRLKLPAHGLQSR